MLSLDHSLNSLALHQLGRGMDINQEHTMQGTTLVFAPALSFCLASLVPQMVKNLPAVWETWVASLGWEDLWRREWQLTPIFLPGESMDRGGRGHKESDMTEQLAHFLLPGYTSPPYWHGELLLIPLDPDSTPSSL